MRAISRYVRIYSRVLNQILNHFWARTVPGPMPFWCVSLHLQYLKKKIFRSVGCTIVDMLCGNPPNSELQDIQALFRVGNEKIAKYSLPTETSLEMVEFVALLLEPESKDRPSAVEALEHPLFDRFNG